MTKIRIKPETTVVWCKYTLIEPVSHYDPAQTDSSNFSLYRRQLRRLQIDAAGEQIEADALTALTEKYPVPVEIADFFADEPPSRFLAICMIKIFIAAYGRGQGFGLFSGVQRYRRLEEHLTQTAAHTTNLKTFWSILTKTMNVYPLGGGQTHSLMQLLVQPRGFVEDILYQFATHPQMIRMLAQTWVEQEKLEDSDYAAKADKPVSSGEKKALRFAPPEKNTDTEISVAIPVHSGNDIRHNLRQAAMYHLLDRLDIGFDETLPLHIRTLLENGGAMSQSSPTDAFQRSQQIRANYPTLGLLGGCMPNYMLGEGNLQSVGAFFKGREHNDVLAEIGIHATESVTTLIDRWTLTRQTLRTEENPLPFEFEVIQAGVKLYVRFQFHPFITERELGAFVAAIQTFEETIAAIGGQGARGFGRVKIEYLKVPDGLFEKRVCYEQHLAENKETLREWMLDGTLGTK